MDSTVLKVGRPLLFEDAETLGKAIAGAIASLEGSGKPIIVENIALELGTSSETLRKYRERADARPDFYGPIKDMFDVCKAWQVSKLYSERGNVAGAIFALKNNYPDEYRDKIETESTVVADVTSNGQTIANPELAQGYADWLSQQTKGQ
jgi:hypothetical protein